MNQSGDKHADAAAGGTPQRSERSEVFRPVVEPAITMEVIQRYVQEERIRTRRMVVWIGLFFLILVALVVGVLIGVGYFIARQSLGSATDMRVLSAQGAKTEERVSTLLSEFSSVEANQEKLQSELEQWQSGFGTRDERLKGDLQNFSRWVNENNRRAEESVAALEKKLADMEAQLKVRNDQLARLSPSAQSTTSVSTSSMAPPPAAAPTPPAAATPSPSPVVSTPAPTATVTAAAAVEHLTESEVLARSLVEIPALGPDDMMSQSFPDGDKYRGQFKAGVMHGWGSYEEEDGTLYEGYFVEGLRQGKGILRTPAGERYEGDFVGDRRHGYGVMVMSNGDRYAGQFRDDKVDGYGTMSYANGNRYIGGFRAGTKHGPGTFTFANGDIYAGQFVEDAREGTGRYTFVDGSLYEGEFLSGNRHGFGTYTYPGGEKYVGEFRSGKKNGKGMCIYPDGTEIETRWKDDQLVDEL